MYECMTASEIADGLLLASFEESFDRAALAAHGVTHVLNVADECVVSCRVDLTYAKFGAIRDDCADDDISAILPDCIAFIDSRRGSIVVHCLEGRSRSACVVLAYLVTRRGMTWDDALDRIARARPAVDVFPPFLEQTRRWCAIRAGCPDARTPGRPEEGDGGLEGGDNAARAQV